MRVSIVSLLATPERYDGKIVQIKGYLNLQFESDAIYLHKEDWEQSIISNALWVQLPEGGVFEAINEGTDYSRFSGHYVLLAGTFNSQQHGHMGAWPAEISHITRLQILEPRHLHDSQSVKEPSQPLNPELLEALTRSQVFDELETALDLPAD